MEEKKTKPTAEKAAPKTRRIVSAADAKAEKTAKAAAKPKKAPTREPEAEETAETSARAKAEAPKRTAKTSASGNGESVKGLRIGAIVLWVLAVAAEVGAFFALSWVVRNKAVFGDIEVWYLIGALVLDAIFCIVAAQLWKKSNRIRPCLADSKLVRTLWHQLGVIMVLVCFLPIGIFLLTKSKELDKKLKNILTVGMAALLVLAGLLSTDFKQPSDAEVAELQQQAIAENADGTVYWTRFGKSYHFDENCQSLRRSEELITGTLDEAFEHNRWDPCDFCAGGGEAEAN